MIQTQGIGSYACKISRVSISCQWSLFLYQNPTCIQKKDFRSSCLNFNKYTLPEDCPTWNTNNNLVDVVNLIIKHLYTLYPRSGKYLSMDNTRPYKYEVLLSLRLADILLKLPCYLLERRKSLLIIELGYWWTSASTWWGTVHHLVLEMRAKLCTRTN